MMVVQDFTPLAVLQEEKRKGQHPVILVAEDHLPTQKILARWLALQGYQPACATNGQKALQWMEQTWQTPEYPRAILLDLWLPLMDGRQFLAALRRKQAQPLPPVILLSGEYCNAAQLDCSASLLKPFHLADLRDCLEQVCQMEQ